MNEFIAKTYKRVRPTMIAIFGVTIVLIGMVMIFLPGPGLLVILAGLAVLATEFVWAKSLLMRVKSVIGKMKKNPPAKS